MGKGFIKGKSRNIEAESAAYVVFQTQYLQQKAQT